MGVGGLVVWRVWDGCWGVGGVEGVGWVLGGWWGGGCGMGVGGLVGWRVWDECWGVGGVEGVGWVLGGWWGGGGGMGVEDRMIPSLPPPSHHYLLNMTPLLYSMSWSALALTFLSLFLVAGCSDQEDVRKHNVWICPFPGPHECYCGPEEDERRENGD